MKHLNLIKFFIGSLLLLLANTVQAQLDSCNIFLKGPYIEVGINTNGAYGSSVAAPLGFHPTPSAAPVANVCSPSISTCPNGNLGFVADPDKDGWTVGTPPFIGDYFLPGDPQEGWAVQINGTMIKAFNGGGYDACGSGIPYKPAGKLTGKNISYYTSGNKITGVWQGKMDSVIITQTTVLDTSKVFFTVFISMVNTGRAVRHNVYYLRTVDPDNDVDETGGAGYTTDNSIEYQLPNAQNRTLVSATGPSGPIAFLGLGTLDCRAKCFIVHGSLSPDWGHLDTMYGVEHYIDTTHYQYHGVDTNDEGIGLVFKLGDIQPNDSITFAYAYVLRIGDLDSAFESTRPRWKAARDSSSHTSGDTALVCANSTVTVNVVNGTGLKWKWDSPTGNTVLDSAGITTRVEVDTDVTIVRAIGVSPSCANDTQLIYLKSYIPPQPILSNNGPLCLGETLQLHAVPTDTSAAIITWHGPNGFMSNDLNAIRPNIQAPDSGEYYVLDSIIGCPALKTTTTVHINQVVASIAPSRPAACAGSPMDFTFDGVANPGTTFKWTFDHGVQLSGDPGDTSVGPYTIRWDSLSTRVVTLSLHYRQCSSYTAITIPVISAPPVHFDMPKDICIYDTVLVAASDYSLPNADSFEWNFGNGGNFTVTASGLKTGHAYAWYNTPGVKVVALTVDYTQCTQNPYYDTVTVHNLPNAAIVNMDKSICIGDTVIFSAVTTNDLYKYIWAPSRDVVNKTANKVRILIPFAGNIYLTVRDQYDCHATDSVYINPNNCCQVVLPSAFSPNGDGRNDLFRPITIGHHKLKMFQIVNRYGQTVYLSNVESNGWDGKFGGVPQDIGTYFYYLSYDCNGKTIEEKGDFTLVR
ncbi:MAG: gliding motility-associated C-terminal domain-containing protein [Flavipsychrobacter sp.]